jgi:ferric-dicitrate binding protein FerR (iron transport regulator)
LANGKKIILTKGLNGLLARQGGTSVSATAHNITYTASTAKHGDQISYNTLSTARGEQSPYPLVLEDGTKVWLNAESSITFPTAFTGKERTVKVTGQARFEVAHNAEHPFKVQTEKQTIEDIGTVFDVNAYPDEPATLTTLVEGKVKVNSLVLSPGQQTDGTHIKTVDVNQFTAWSHNDFNFHDENIQSIMRQLTRWYNIEVTYEGTITTAGLNAHLTRSRNISSVLHVLERTKGVHFKIEGRRVTVIE